MDMSALMGDGVTINIKGKDLDKLQTISEDMMKKLEKVDGLDNITNGLKMPVKSTALPWIKRKQCVIHLRWLRFISRFMQK